VIVLRPWRDEDIVPALTGHDAEVAHWLASPFPAATVEGGHEGVAELRRDYAGGRRAGFVIDHDGTVVGSVEVRDVGNGTGRLSWTLFADHRGQGFAARAVRLLVDYALVDAALDGLGLSRVEAEIEPGNDRALRVATRAGLHREGVKRVAPGTGDRDETTEYVVLARLATDPPITDPTGFRALLNSFLPRKRAISQLLVRDADDRVLLCQLTYKRDWDLPGGVVEVGESPQRAVVREVEEELGLHLPARRLLLTDWLPPWGGWDDALCLVFDGGVVDPALLDRVVKQVREIASVELCTTRQVEDRAADFTARRIEAALNAVHADAPRYTESGR
jgi:RimJ/RimL family protein N-acetyltransferase